jgi:hypothetical protein
VAPARKKKLDAEAAKVKQTVPSRPQRAKKKRSPGKPKE